MKAKVTKITRSLVVLVLAIGIAAVLIKLKQKPQKQPPSPASPLLLVPALYMIVKDLTGQ